MSKKEALLKIFELGINTDKIRTVLLIVKHKEYPEAEIIAVPKENFKLKAQYINNNYTEDLVLKSCEDIKLLGIRIIDKKGEVIIG